MDLYLEKNYILSLFFYNFSNIMNILVSFPNITFSYIPSYFESITYLILSPYISFIYYGKVKFDLLGISL